jgi:thioredoxin 1
MPAIAMLAVAAPDRRNAMLSTNLKHITIEAEFKDTLGKNENVAIVCGRMGPMCIPVYDVMEKLEPKYPHVQFRDLEFDGPVGHLIRNLPEVRNFNGLPFTVYFRHGKVVAATSSIQTKQQVTEILNRELAPAAMRSAA